MTNSTEIHLKDCSFTIGFGDESTLRKRSLTYNADKKALKQPLV